MSKITPPAWFKPIVILALLWNVMGIFNFYLQITLTTGQILDLPAAEQALLNNILLYGQT